MGEWSAARPGRTLPPGKSRHPFYRRLGGPQGRSGRVENLVPTGIRSRTVRPVAQSLYRLSYPAHLCALYLMLFKSDEKLKKYGKILLSSLRKLCLSMHWFSWNSKFLICIIWSCVPPNITQIGGEIWEVGADMYLYLHLMTHLADMTKRTPARLPCINKFSSEVHENPKNSFFDDTRSQTDG